MNVIFYKTGNSVTNTKPKIINKTTLIFHVTIDSRANDQNDLSLMVKNFIKYIVVDIKELNLLKNDICFLMNELYHENDFVNHIVPLKTGVIFYVWVYIAPSTEVFPFDLFFIRKSLSNEDVSKIKTIMKNEMNVEIHTRSPDDVKKISPKVNIIRIEEMKS